jgi:hypothetical protein
MAHRRHRPRSGCGGRRAGRQDELFDQAWAELAEAWEKERGVPLTWLDVMQDDFDEWLSSRDARTARWKRRKAGGSDHQAARSTKDGGQARRLGGG